MDSISVLDIFLSLSLMISPENNYCCDCPPNYNTITKEFNMKFKKGNRWRSSKGQVRYKSWRKGVFELNKAKHGGGIWYKCLKCDKKRKTTRVLHAHHIYSWDKFPSRRYSMKNGVVLCKYCHDKFHRTYKFEALDNPKLLDEYLGKKK